MGREKVNKYLFVGERRSKKAREKNWSWRLCQKEESGRLCAIQLFTALTASGLDIQKQVFLNLWNDEGKLISGRRQKLSESKLPIVAMGQKVQQQLESWEIDHIAIVHPAARGIWRRQKVYNQHILSRLRSL